MTLPKKMFDNILMEIDPTIAAVSVMQILLVSIVLVLIGRFGRGPRAAARVEESAMADSVFHKDFKAMPWWWEWWHPTNELSQDPPRKTDVLVVGAGYGGLSTALELARSGVEVTVLERGDFGVGASTRNGGGVSGGTTLGKGFSGKGVRQRPRGLEEGDGAHAEPTPPIRSPRSRR